MPRFGFRPVHLLVAAGVVLGDELLRLLAIQPRRNDETIAGIVLAKHGPRLGRAIGRRHGRMPQKIARPFPL